MLMIYVACLGYFLIRALIAAQGLWQAWSSGRPHGGAAQTSVVFSSGETLSVIIPVQCETRKLAVQYQQWSRLIPAVAAARIAVVFVFPRLAQASELVATFQALAKADPCPAIGYALDLADASSKCSKIDHALQNVVDSQWVGVIDCDTSVEPSAIDEVIGLLAKARVVQLVPVSAFARNSSAAVLYRSMRVYRTLFLEQSLGLAGWRKPWLRRLLGFRYLCGASMFFHRQVYEAYGPFPVWNDDMYLGYSLSANHEDVAVCRQVSSSPFPQGGKNVFWHRMRIRYMSLKAAWPVVISSPCRSKALVQLSLGMACDLNKEIGVLWCVAALSLFDGGALLAVLLLLSWVELMEYAAVRERLKQTEGVSGYSVMDHFIILPGLSLIELTASLVTFFWLDGIRLSKRVTAK
ncbi:glycosyltransferase [Pseudomonas monteilii]|nr:glycosyltransferase [Pseudomonas monteilii]